MVVIQWKKFGTYGGYPVTRWVPLELPFIGELRFDSSADAMERFFTTWPTFNPQYMRITRCDCNGGLSGHAHWCPAFKHW